MMDRSDCLKVIGDITVQWSEVEDTLRELLWVYVGTDRQTFDLLFSKSRGSDVEMLLKRLVNAKEVEASAKLDAIEAVARSKTVRDNRNDIVHKMRENHVADAELLYPKLKKARDEAAAHCKALKECRRRLALFVSERDALETADGELDYPASEERSPTYTSLLWPPQIKRLNLE
ncbi:hypothetical protein [Tateyamaria sp.]|uniref:hypothetical protein n=1 Tax=Tateyamaria sp. TaxID=1929288 RepID=UPI00329EAAE0